MQHEHAPESTTTSTSASTTNVVGPNHNTIAYWLSPHLAADMNLSLSPDLMPANRALQPAIQPLAPIEHAESFFPLGALTPPALSHTAQPHRNSSRANPPAAASAAALAAEGGIMMLYDLQEAHNSRSILNSAYRDYRGGNAASYAHGVPLVAEEEPRLSSDLPSSPAASILGTASTLLGETSASTLHAAGSKQRGRPDGRDANTLLPPPSAATPPTAHDEAVDSDCLRKVPRRLSPPPVSLVAATAAHTTASAASAPRAAASPSSTALDSPPTDVTDEDVPIRRLAWRVIREEALSHKDVAQWAGVSLPVLDSWLAPNQKQQQGRKSAARVAVRQKLASWLRQRGVEVPELPDVASTASSQSAAAAGSLAEVRERWNLLNETLATSVAIPCSPRTLSGRAHLTPQHMFVAYVHYLNYRERNGHGGAGDEEYFCFKCKDGGDVMLCDFHSGGAGQCCKAYHTHCCNLTAVPAGDWECPRHRCKGCGCGVVDSSGDSDDSRLWPCRTCPQTYCAKCLPPGVLRIGSEMICEACQPLLKCDLAALQRDLVEWDKVLK